VDWFMSDPHFGHRNILKFESEHRPYADVDEMDWSIIRNINDRVMPTDKLYILGDIAFNSKHDRLSHINAQQIIIILGNHDYPNKIPDIMLPGVKVAGCLEYKGCILTHIPVHESQKARFRANIHGHLHDAEVKDRNGHPDKWYYNAGMERHNMCPVLWSDIAKVIPKEEGDEDAYYDKVRK